MSKENIFSFVNRVWPKRNIVLFNSFPDLSGNAFAVYKHIVVQRPDILRKYKLIWTISEISVIDAVQYLQQKTECDNHIVIEKKGLLGIISFFSAKYVVSTHGYFPGVKTVFPQRHINLWHGMPFKRIGRLLDEEVHSNGKIDEADVTIATSECFRKLMARAFGISTDEVHVTGQPCADVLLSSCDTLSQFGVERKNYKRVLGWLPTYRKSIVGDIRSDGEENGFGVADLFSSHFDELNQILREKQYLLIIKPHPMDVLCTMTFPESKNIKVIKNQELRKKSVELYELLSDIDVLLTDYSSVFIDFLATGRPMAFVCEDIEKYGDTRGFSFENPREFMPGELLTNYMEFMDYLLDIDGYNCKWKDKYHSIKEKFYPSSDASASSRVCELFEL